MQEKVGDNPALVRDLHPTKNNGIKRYSEEIRPEELSIKSNRRIWWQCHECEHEWKTAIYNRYVGNECSVCKRGSLHSDGRNSLAAMYPEIAVEYVGDATAITAKTSRRANWVCSVCGDSWKTQVYNRTVLGRGCLACTNQKVHDDGRNSLAVMFPTLAEELIGDPHEVLATTNKKLRWRCNACSHEWDATGNKRAREGQGCNACANKVLHNDGRNSLLAMFPEIAEELLGDPSHVIATTKRKFEWICSTCNHKWPAAVHTRTVMGTGCPVCSNQAIHRDLRNAMSRTHPELAKELIGNPDEVITGTNKKLDWQCSICQHTWSAVGSSRGDGSGCPACSNREVHDDGRNSLAVAQPELAKEYLGDATKVVATTHKKLRWKCAKCELEWPATAYSRVNGSGCPGCSSHGFQANEVGWYYSLRLFNQDGDTVYFKGGITNDVSRRIEQIRKKLPDTLALELVESLRFEVGQHARDLETELLRIQEIRAPKRDFDGGNELFIENPIEHARRIGLVR
jgi:Zn finger protein HypA/HybF involved in hydrogenase expression